MTIPNNWPAGKSEDLYNVLRASADYVLETQTQDEFGNTFPGRYEKLMNKNQPRFIAAHKWIGDDGHVSHSVIYDGTAPDLGPVTGYLDWGPGYPEQVFNAMKASGSYTSEVVDIPGLGSYEYLKDGDRIAAHKWDDIRSTNNLYALLD